MLRRPTALIQEALGFLLYALTESFQAIAHSFASALDPIAHSFANALDPIAHMLETSVRALSEPDNGTLRLGRVGRHGRHLRPQDHSSEYDDGQKEYSHAGPYDLATWIVPGVKKPADRRELEPIAEWLRRVDGLRQPV